MWQDKPACCPSLLSNRPCSAPQLRRAHQYTGSRLSGSRYQARHWPGSGGAEPTYFILDFRLYCSGTGGRHRSSHATSSTFSVMRRDPVPAPSRSQNQASFMIALPLFPQTVDLPVPNKSILPFLLFLFSLTRLPLRPFLSDNERGTLSSWACVGPSQGRK